jgi:hypothetical protein
MMMMRDGSWHLPDERRGEERERERVCVCVCKVMSQRGSKEENMMAWQGRAAFLG